MARLASQFVALPPAQRTLAFAQTAARMAVSSFMVETDFWVSWLLGLLFADPAWSNRGSNSASLDQRA